MTKRLLLAPALLLALAAAAGTADAAPSAADALSCYADALGRAGLSLDRQGVVFETLGGERLVAHNADLYFNPASVVKLATSAAALERLGFDYRFPTEFYTDGVLDPASGELAGDLVVVGSGDPVFDAESAFRVAEGLRARGISRVTGDLIVRGPFYYDHATNAQRSASALRSALNRAGWGSSTLRAWDRFRALNGAPEFRSVPISGKVVPAGDLSLAGLTPLFTFRSAPLPAILKQQNNYSNNWMAHVLGARVGGAPGVETALAANYGLPLWAVHLQTTSGLGKNDMRPGDITDLLRKLAPRLRAKGLAPADILPVAGADPGTLEDRYLEPDVATCVVAKTGTLRGVSSLAGYMYTKDRGVVAFAILNHGGAPATFRRLQDLLVREMLEACGGPARIAYARPAPAAGAAGGLIEPSRARIPESPRAEAAVGTGS